MFEDHTHFYEALAINFIYDHGTTEHLVRCPAWLMYV
jgi:hypothetical protein